MMQPNSEQSYARRTPMAASALVHALFAVLIFSLAAPQGVRQVRHIVMPVFAPQPERQPLPSPPRSAVPLHRLPIPRSIVHAPAPQPLPAAPALAVAPSQP